MTIKRGDLWFSETPRVEFAGNYFIDVPVILQFDDTPLIEVISEQEAGFTSQFRIYNRDGIYLAAVKGSQLYLTDDGSKANLSLRHPDKVTVCELDGQTLFEVRRTEAAGIRTEAELYTPDGRFMRAAGGVPHELLAADSSGVQLRGVLFSGNTLVGSAIGFHVMSNGSFRVGVGRRSS